MSGPGGAHALIDDLGVVPQRLRPPVTRPDQLHRTALVARVLASEAPVVVVVQAGAGYGKSTLLTQIAATDGRPFGWVTLDPADDDPVVFFRHLVRALGDAGVDVSEVVAELGGSDPDLRRRVLPMLASVLDRTVEPFLLLLDDVHVLARDEAVRIGDELAQLIPSGSTVVLSGRAMPELRLARRELDGGVARFGEADLAYTVDESRDLLARALPDLPSSAVADVLRVTEGWPAGLHLAVLALRDHPDPPVVIEGLLASDRRVVDYLQQEGVALLDPDLRQFLLDVSVLGPLSPALCDAATGRSDSAELLDRLVVSGNLFVAPVQGQGSTYRIHRLFADLLLKDLRTVDPGREREVRRRAARWLDERGDGDGAVLQAVAAGDLDLAAEIVHRRHAAVIQRGETATIERWLGLFPGEALAADGLLSVVAGWLAVTEGDRRAVAHHLDVARASSLDGRLPDGTVDLGVAIAALEMVACIDGLDAAIRSVRIVVEAGPDGSPWWAVARQLEAVMLVAAGRADPLEALSGAELDTRGRSAVHALTVAHLALAHLRSGDRAQADRLARAALDEVAENGLRSYSLTGMVHCIASLTAATVGDHPRSRRHAGDAESILQITRHMNARAAVQARQLIAEAALVRGEPDIAARLLPAARSNLAQEPAAIELERLQSVLEQRLRAARAHPEVQELTAAELRVLGQLPTHRSLEEIGEHLFVSRNTVKTHTLSIYRKLGVSSRSQAVVRAEELGVIEDLDPPDVPG